MGSNSNSSRTYPPLPYPHSHSDLVTAHLVDAIKVNKDPAVAMKLQECFRLVSGLNDYVDKNAVEETPLQRKVLSDSHREPWDDNYAAGKTMFKFSVVWASGYVEGQFLRIISQITRAKRILEIGMFTGYGVVSMAESKYCEEMVALDIDPFLANFVKERVAGTSVEKKLQIILGRAIDSLQGLKDEGKTFDLIFIDADKSNYINYYNFIMDNDLLAPAGSILVDNTLWRGECFPTPSTPTGKAISDFNAVVANDSRVIQVILPLKDGVTLITRKVAE